MKSTPVARRYLWELLLRLVIFCCVAATFVLWPASLDFTRTESGDSPLFILWLGIFASMVSQLWPTSPLSVGCRKQFSDNYMPVEDFDPQLLSQAVRGQNRGAVRVAAVWLAINGCFGLGYHLGVLQIPQLVLLCALAYLCDLICVLFFCPFQTFFMHNRCCVNCRIFAWGAWMMAAPLMWVPHLYAQSLFWTGVAVWLLWEVRFSRHPERFWHGSNRQLQCSSCREQLCKYKYPPTRREGGGRDAI